MEKKGIKILRIRDELASYLIPKDVNIINKKHSIFKTHLREVMVAITIIVLFFLMVSLYWSYKLAIINKNLALANKEIEIARNKAEKLSRIDQLSGMYNRRAFYLYET